MFTNNSTNTTSKQNITSSPYRDVTKGSNRPITGIRGRDNQKKQNVWTKRTVPTSENDKSIIETEKDSEFILAQQMNTLTVKDSHEINQVNSRNNQRNKEDSTNGNIKEERKVFNKREKKYQQTQQFNKNEEVIEKQKQDEGQTKQSKGTKLSLAAFHSSLNGPEDEDGADETPSRVLWVGNIGPDVSEQELEQEFGQFGKIESLRILHNRFCAFVNFELEEAALNAKKNLHGTIIGSQYIVIHFRKFDVLKPTLSTPDSNFVLNSPSRALWIGNISDDVTEEELTSEFQRYGNIESVRVLRNKTCAFVNFISVEEASNALQGLQGKVLGNMAIKINFGKPQTSMPPKSMIPSENMNQQYLPQTNYIQEYQQYGMPFGVYSPHYYSYGTYENLYERIYDPMYSRNFCEICSSNFKEVIFSPCGHCCCSQCINKLPVGPDTITKCPWCDQAIQKIGNLNFVSPYPTGY
jgi:RNA recognition motif-containing protein